MMNQQDIEFVKKFFGNQADKSNLPQWQHGINVARVLEEFIDAHSEIRDNKKNDLLLGALGHDLLEDTTASEAEIRQQWGEKVLCYIKEMTNTKGDDNFDEYIEHLKNVDEEVLLIKFADILANTGNSLKNISLFPEEWLKFFWIPLLERYDTTLLHKTFRIYPATLNAMAQKIKTNIERIKMSRGR